MTPDLRHLQAVLGPLALVAVVALIGLDHPSLGWPAALVAAAVVGRIPWGR